MLRSSFGSELYKGREVWSRFSLSQIDYSSFFRQMNMDYCVSQSLLYRSRGLRRGNLYYDIMCQYWTNLLKRFQDNPHLEIPWEFEIKRAIGLFHVHGHKDECFARFAPTYIPGVGMVDGEILESLWAVLNGTSDSIRSMSTAHRREHLDDQMNDSNWKKLADIGMRPFYPTKF